MMSSACLNLPVCECVLLRLVEVHTFFSIAFADNHSIIRSNMASEALNTLKICVFIICLALKGYCAGTAAAFGLIFSGDNVFHSC